MCVPNFHTLPGSISPPFLLPSAFLPPSFLFPSFPPSFPFISFSKEGLSSFLWCEKKKGEKVSEGSAVWKSHRTEEEKKFPKLRITESLQRYGMVGPSCSYLVPTSSPSTCPEQSCSWGWSRQVAECQGGSRLCGCFTGNAEESPLALDLSLLSGTGGCWGKERGFWEDASSEIYRSSRRRPIAIPLEWASSIWHSKNWKGPKQVA